MIYKLLFARAFDDTQDRTGRSKVLGIALLRKDNKSSVNANEIMAADENMS
jgi:hypothetical protein